MKRFILFFFLFLVVSFFYFSCTQQGGKIELTKGAIPIHLKTEYENYIKPEDSNLRVNSIYAFVSEDGKDYAVIVRDANEFMEEAELHFKVRANSNTQPGYFTVKDPKKFEYFIEIYCLTDDNWPDAPPRIIVVSQ